MNRHQAPTPRPPKLSWRKKLWMAGFVLLAVLVYTPWVAPYGKHEPFHFGLPYTLFWWMLLTLLLLLNILLFVLLEWREKEDNGARD